MVVFQKIFLVSLFYISSLVIFPSAYAKASSDAIQVVFLAPDHVDSPFWNSMLKVMMATAEDLNVDIEVARLSANEHNRFGVLTRYKEIASRDNKPDYFISIMQSNVEKELLTIIEEAKLPFFSINVHIPDQVFEEVGQPREKYKYWLGHVAPDDVNAGQALSDELIKQARTAQPKPDEQVNVVGIGGPSYSSVSRQRLEGLESSVSVDEQSLLQQVVYGNWGALDAESKTNKLLKRHENIQVIWTVSDGVALGAIKAAKESGREPGKNLFVGGFDWTLRMLDAIENGDAAVSLGGHFLEGAKAIILLHDYHHNVDFVDDVGVVMQTTLSVVTSDNVAVYRNKFTNPTWSDVDFKQFSRAKNKTLQHYDLSTEAFFNKLPDKH